MIGKSKDNLVDLCGPQFCNGQEKPKRFLKQLNSNAFG